jgi:hypothetical protein
VGRASISIRDRVGVHLDTFEKRAATSIGTAYWLYYILRAPDAIAAIERGWINQSILETGSRPLLNKIGSSM